MNNLMERQLEELGFFYDRDNDDYSNANGNIIFDGATIFRPIEGIRLIKLCKIQPFTYELDNYEIGYIDGLYPIRDGWYTIYDWSKGEYIRYAHTVYHHNIGDTLVNCDVDIVILSGISENLELVIADIFAKGALSIDYQPLCCSTITVYHADGTVQEFDHGDDSGNYNALTYLMKQKILCEARLRMTKTALHE